MSLIRTNASLNSLILAPHVQSARGCVCVTCGRLVDEESIVEGYPGQTTWAKVLVRHHGAEELRTFEMGSSNWDETDLSSLMRRANWFVPNSGDGLDLGQRMTNPGEHDERDAPKIISVGGGK